MKKIKDEKIYILLQNSIGAFIFKGLSFLLSLIIMPIYMNFFNNQSVLGIWFTIISLLNWILTFDLGIGNGLRNKLVSALQRKDESSIKQLISSSYVMAIFLSISVSVLATFFLYSVDILTIFNISASIVNEDSLHKAITITIIGIAFQFVLKLVYSVLYALQRSMLVNLCTLLTSTLTIVLVYFSPSESVEKNLIRMSIINAFSINISLLILSIYVYIKFFKKYKFAFSDVKIAIGKKVLFLGSSFLGIQILYMLISTTNEMIISYFISPASVVDYQIYNKIFTSVGIVLSLALTPIWSMITKAKEENDYIWIKKIIRYLDKSMIIIIMVQGLLIPISPFLVNIWLGKNAISLEILFCVICALYGLVFAYTNTLTTIANGLENLKIQFFSFLGAAILKIPLTMIINSWINSWISVMVATIICLVPYCIIQSIYFKKMERSAINVRK